MEFVKQQIKNGVDEEKIWAEVEAVAAELDRCVCQYLREDTSADFVDAVLRSRALTPKATTAGVFNVVMILGLRSLRADDVAQSLEGSQPKPAKTRGSRKVRGV